MRESAVNKIRQIGCVYTVTQALFSQNRQKLFLATDFAKKQLY